MCDYSLFAIRDRIAIEGEQLIVHRFPTGSLGLAAIVDVALDELARRQRPQGSLWERIKDYFSESAECSRIPAVCVPPGARLILKAIPGFTQQVYGLQPEEGAVFVQINADANTYGDALRFHNSAQIRLQDLREGQLVEVLSLAGTSAAPYQREPQMQ